MARPTRPEQDAEQDAADQDAARPAAGVGSLPLVDEAWAAIVARDDAADGRFVFAVRTTGIYCRPSCPSRRPRRENVVLYPEPWQAEAAGYRACRRCTPDGVSRKQWVVAQVKHQLETAEPTPTLADLGSSVGLSPAYVQRLFKGATGLSPKKYADALKAERVIRDLAGGSNVARAQYAAGYGSGRALYQAAGGAIGMTPGRYRRGGAGVTIHYGFFDTPVGRALIALTERGVCALRFGSDDATVAELVSEFPKATLRHDQEAVAAAAEAVQRALDGHQEDGPDLDVQATDFQRRVWTVLRRIPPGATLSYRQVAEAIGQPAAVRAVARACAANPVALVIPCHRVVRASGALAGYRWGVERKRALLQREGWPGAGDGTR